MLSMEVVPIVHAAVSFYGRIDIIVNNAEMGDDCLLKDLTHDC